MNTFSTESMSPYFFESTKEILFSGLRYAIQNKSTFYGNNCYIKTAPTAYILSITALEAILNEVFLDPLSQQMNPNIFQPINKENIRNLSIEDKLIHITKWYFGKAFDKSRQPFQKFKNLVNLRNELVHYKFYSPPGFLKNLIAEKISLPHPDISVPGNAIVLPQPWTYYIRSSEGIRWAINTICEVTNKLHEFSMNSKCKNKIVHISLLSNFTPITETEISEFLSGVI